MAGAEAALDWLCAVESQVSAHYLIDRQGGVTALVDETERAWHAGAGAWGAIRDVNSRAIGIELCNTGRMPFAAPQMTALERLLHGIMARWSIPPARVIAHSDCAPGRKIDPGPRFDWARLSRAGLAAATPTGMADGDFAAAMAEAGYTASDDPAVLLAALRLRHRPWARGPADARDTGIARGLAGQAD